MAPLQRGISTHRRITMATRSATVKRPAEKEEKIESPKGKGKSVPSLPAGKPAPSDKKPAIGKSKYGPDKVITLLVDYNPKRPSSESFKRFEKYEDEMTVAQALKAGIWAGDLNWDVDHGFVKIADDFDDDVEKKSKPEPKPRVAKPKAEKPARSKGGKKGKEEEEEEEEEEEC
jgi:hypothetical protein